MPRLGQGYRREQWEQWEKSLADEELRALLADARPLVAEWGGDGEKVD